MNKLILGLPKGSLQDATFLLMKKAGFAVTVGSRSYIPNVDDPTIEARLIRAQEISRYVEHGLLDAGVTGLDWIMENDSKVVEIADLIYAKQGLRPVRWVVAVPNDSPIRTVADLQNDTVLRLAQVPNIVGIKDATASLERGSDLLRRAPAEFAVYSGEDSTGLPLMLMGGHGVISVTANVAPRLMQEMCAAALSGDIARARAANNRLLGLHSKLFVEGNPIPVKWALQQMGLIESGIRLPLVPLSANFHEVVRAAMRQAGIQVADAARTK